MEQKWYVVVRDDGWTVTVYAPFPIDIEYDDVALRIVGNLTIEQRKEFAERLAAALNKAEL